MFAYIMQINRDYTHSEWLFRQLELAQLRCWFGKESESARKNMKSLNHKGHENSIKDISCQEITFISFLIHELGQ